MKWLVGLFARRNKLVVPNWLQTTESHKELLQQMLVVVENTDGFRNLRGRRSVSCAEIVSAEEIVRDYINPGREIGGEWPNQLAKIIDDHEQIGVVEVHSFESQREGTGLTCFIDPEKLTVLLQVTGPLSVY